jgi:glycosyltransferase involved in cell wall biosynthesis
MVDGVGDYTFNVAKTFASHGHAVTIVCKQHQQATTSIPNLQILPMVERWDKQTGRAIAQIIQERSVDVVSLQYVPHAYNPKGMPFSLIGAVKEIRKTGVPLMIFCHEVQVFVPNGTWRRRLVIWASGYVTRRLLSMAQLVATSIEYYGELMRRLCPDKGQIPMMPIASNIPLCQLSDDERLSLRRQVADDSETLVAFFGLRDVAASMSALERLIQQEGRKEGRKEGRALKVLFIGKCPANFPYASLPYVATTGVLPVEEVSKYFHIPDIFILPEALYVGCCFKSGSLAAALQNGLPVVTNKGLLTSPQLIHGENIVFTDFSNEDAICESISFLCDHPEERQRIGSNARKLLENRTWEATYQEYMKLIAQ